MSAAIDLRNFAFEDSLVRVHMDDDSQPWFVAKDVARALEYSEASLNQLNNLFRHIPEEWADHKSIMSRSENGVVQCRDMLCLSEQGLYFFVARSDKPAALPFQKWLAGEVLPTLRKTGAYALPGQESQVGMADAESMALLPDTELIPYKCKVTLMHEATQIAKTMNRKIEARQAALYVAMCNKVVEKVGSSIKAVAEEQELRKPFLSPKEVAALYGISVATLKVWRKEGKGPKYNKPVCNGPVWYKRQDIDDYITGNSG